MFQGRLIFQPLLSQNYAVKRSISSLGPQAPSPAQSTARCDGLTQHSASGARSRCALIRQARAPAVPAKSHFRKLRMGRLNDY